MERGKRVQIIIGIACVNLATFAWATNMVIGRWLKDSVGPVTISAVRFIIASMLFAAILRHLPSQERSMGRDRWLIIAMAVTGVMLFSPILYLGLRYTTAVNSTIINGFSPLVTGLLAAWLIHEPLSARQISGSVLAMLGVVFLISGGSFAFWSSSNINAGDLIILAAVTTWGLYSVCGGKVMRNRSSLSATALSTLIGTPALCLLAVIEIQYIPVSLDWKVLLALVYVGVVPAAAGFYAWNKGVARLGPAGATVFMNMLPVYGALLGIMFLDEPLGFPHVAGGLLIISGGLLAALKRPRRKLI
jgi:drug/metabolite transporter (DMT)-like permease